MYDIFFRNVNFKYSDRNVLSNFSMDFSSPKIRVLMGKNGCGKSTLLDLICGKILPESGAIDRILKTDTIEYIPQDYRSAIFFWKTVKKNIYPWHEENSVVENKKKVLDILQTLNILDKKNTYPSRLSGGQQQKLLLARCMFSSPSLVILDEPFSALDVMARQEVADIMRKQWRLSNTVVMAAMHEPDAAVLLADEVILCGGPPFSIESIIQRPNLDSDYKALSEFRESIVAGLAKI